MMGIPLFAQIPTGIYMGGALGNDLIQMILHAGPVVKMVLWILLIFSVTCWTVIFMKLRLIRMAKRDTADFLELFWESADLKRTYAESESCISSPAARLFRAGYVEFNRILKLQNPVLQQGDAPHSSEMNAPGSPKALIDSLERSMKRAEIDQMNRLERGITFLATTGNTAPFIGLFGTVWGIMESFRGIGLKGSASLAVVAPGISEALIATAAGLAAAIPAVVAFNYFTRRISVLRAEMDIFTSDFISVVERHLFRSRRTSKRIE
jgi:biopolymer transport protein TolQ